MRPILNRAIIVLKSKNTMRILRIRKKQFKYMSYYKTQHNKKQKQTKIAKIKLIAEIVISAIAFYFVVGLFWVLFCLLLA